MNTFAMERRLASLPAGLSATEVSRRLGVSHQTARLAMKKHRYAGVDGRRFSQNSRRRFNPDLADWSKPNHLLAKQFGVSRERVRVLREQLGKPFVEARGRKSVNECSCGRHNRETRYCQRRDC